MLSRSASPRPLSTAAVAAITAASSDSDASGAASRPPSPSPPPSPSSVPSPVAASATRKMVCASPHAASSTRADPDIGTGVSRRASAPEPAWAAAGPMPSCPRSLAPHENAAPPVVMTIVWSPPHATRIARWPDGNGQNCGVSHHSWPA